MDITLYNTLSREKNIFRPIYENTAKIYSCGPTVYDFAHLGNMRSYLLMDFLGRVLRYNGYKTVQVMNITDVGHLVSDGDEGEDKMLKGARRQGKTPWEIAEYYTEFFLRDIDSLNITRPEYLTKATEHIDGMIEFVKALIDKGYGYEISDGVYFDVQKFEGYGKLSRQNRDEMLAGARVDINAEKRNPADFAIWRKASEEHIMKWDSPWGLGYPGWHIECSAMSRQYLGDVFDIHTGGVDAIPVHHENEIAQSEALLGRPAVNWWMHGEFMMIDNGKMSKSLGNMYTLDSLRDKGYDPLAFRYLCLNAHYRSKLNFTWDAIKAAAVSYKRFMEGALAHKNASGPETGVSEFRAEFVCAINDDLNIPKALGVAWNAVRSPQKSNGIYELLLDMDNVLGLNLGRENTSDIVEIEPAVAELLRLREQARADKNWKESDELRDKIKAYGYSVLDTKDGMKIERASD